MKNKTVVIWDWNGTIVDDGFVFVKIMNFFLKEKNLPLINTTKYRDVFEFPLIKYYSKLGFDFNEESFESLGGRFIEQYKKYRFSADLFPNIKETISWLNNVGAIQFVVSAQENSLLASAVQHYGLSPFFVSYHGVNNLLALKKIELAKKIKKLYISPGDQLVVIGDTLHDLEVANSIDAFPILVSFGHCSAERLTKKHSIVCNSVAQLKNILSNRFGCIN